MGFGIFVCLFGLVTLFGFCFLKPLVLISQTSYSPGVLASSLETEECLTVLDFKNSNMKKSWNGGTRFGNRTVATVVTLGPLAFGHSFSGCNFYVNRKCFGSESTGRNVGLVSVCHKQSGSAGLASSLRTLMALTAQGTVCFVQAT